MSGAGNSHAGAFCHTTGLRKRWIAALPTEVCAADVVAGYGPPCCIAAVTLIRGHSVEHEASGERQQVLDDFLRDVLLADVAWSVAVSCPSKPSIVVSRSSRSS